MQLAHEHSTLVDRLEVDVDASDLGACRDAFEEWLCSHSTERERIRDALLAISELVTNACEHGYSGPATATIAEQQSVSTDRVAVLTVTNPTMPNAVAPVDTWVMPANPLALRGRGLAIVARIATEVSLEWSAGQIEITAALVLESVEGDRREERPCTAGSTARSSATVPTVLSPPPPEVSNPRRLAALDASGLLDSPTEESFDRLARLAKRLLNASVSLVSLVDDDRQFFASCVGLVGPFAEQRQSPLSHSICQYALASTEPLVIEDTCEDPRLVDNKAVTDMAARSYLGVPLVDRRGNVLGSFCVLDDKPRAWEQSDIATMVDLAASVMSEISLREAFERQRTIARELQMVLLPASLPTVPGTDLAAHYHAAAAGLDVGGDWYDVSPLDSNRWVFAVGDIVGHGLGAAAAMGQLRHAFSALAANAGDLTSLVERLDQFVLEVEAARFSTMVAVSFDTTTRAIELVSAGHLPALLRRANGEVELIDAPGPPLGLEANIQRQATTAQMQPGDCLLLYTDGLVERAGTLIDTSIDSLAEVLAASEVSEAETVCDEVAQACGPSQRDDVAVMAIIA